MSRTAESIHPRAVSFMEARSKAEKRGDWNMVRCMNVELARMGYADPVAVAAEVAEVEANGNGHADDDAKPRKGGRPKLPRCEHGVIIGRGCEECEAEDEPRQSEPEPSSDAPQSADGESVTGEDAAFTGPQEG